MKWFSDICEAIEKNKSISEERLNYSTLKSNCEYFSRKIDI